MLVLAALLARGGTAVDDAEVAAVLAESEPSPPAQAPSPPAPLPDGDFVVRVDGVDGLRLGMGQDEVVAAGFAVQPRAYDGCRRVLPGLADAGPGAGVAGWLVEDTVAAVTVDRRAGTGSSFLGPGVGGRFADLPGGDGLLRGTTSVGVPWQRAPVSLDVAWLEPEPGVRVSFVDLTGDGSIGHMQVLAESAEGCAAAYEAAVATDVAGLPALDPDGWGDLRIGAPLVRAAELVALQPLEPPEPADDTGRRCRLVLADGEPGLVYVVAGPDGVGGDVVRAIAVDAGATAQGLRIGDPAERVPEVYPGITVAFLDQRWDQGLIADWQLPSGPLLLGPARERVAVTEVDGLLEGPRSVVGLVQVGPGC